MHYFATCFVRSLFLSVAYVRELPFYSFRSQIKHTLIYRNARESVLPLCSFRPQRKRLDSVNTFFLCPNVFVSSNSTIAYTRIYRNVRMRALPFYSQQIQSKRTNAMHCFCFSYAICLCVQALTPHDIRKALPTSWERLLWQEI